MKEAVDAECTCAGECNCAEEGEEDCGCGGVNVECDGKSCKIVFDEEETCDEACQLDALEKLAVKDALESVEEDEEEEDADEDDEEEESDEEDDDKSIDDISAGTDEDDVETIIDDSQFMIGEDSPWWSYFSNGW